MNPTYLPRASSRIIPRWDHWYGAAAKPCKLSAVPGSGNAFPSQDISSQGEATGTYACGAVDIDNPDNGWWLNGHTTLTTDVGFHMGNRQVIEGARFTSGLAINATSVFPLGAGSGAITVCPSGAFGSCTGTASAGAGSIRVAKASVGIFPNHYDTFTIAGDATVYYVKDCVTGATPPNCANGDTSTALYNMAGSSIVTLAITPVLATSPAAGAVITFTAHPVIQFEDQFVTAINYSPNNERIHKAFISCASASGSATGILAVETKPLASKQVARWELREPPPVSTMTKALTSSVRSEHYD